MELKKNLEKVLCYVDAYNITIDKTDEAYFYNVFIEIDKHEKLIKEVKALDVENIQVNIPEVIMCENSNYNPGVDEYQKSVEFFTIRLNRC